MMNKNEEVVGICGACRIGRYDKNLQEMYCPKLKQFFEMMEKSLNCPIKEGEE